MTLTTSHMVITEPVPDVLDALGWTGGECITDSRALIHYMRTTDDGRIAFGWGGGRVLPGSRLTGRGELDRALVDEVVAHLVRFFPQLRGRTIEHGWGGPIDVSPTHLPTFGTLDPGNLFFALGYTGNGVAPSHLAGKVLADLVNGADTDATRLPMVNPKPRMFPPEPLRSIGAAVIRRAIIAKDTAEERGTRPNPVMAAIARLPRRMGYLLGP
jgi:glycine/D-amino acid oxidase-like deaminating enzyme